MQLSATERQKITIQTKAGIVREGPYFDFSYEHLISSVNGSLSALQTDYIDILLLHRPDALVEPDEVARAFDELEGSGKGRAFGVSNLGTTSMNDPMIKIPNGTACAELVRDDRCADRRTGSARVDPGHHPARHCRNGRRRGRLIFSRESPLAGDR